MDVFVCVWRWGGGIVALTQTCVANPRVGQFLHTQVKESYSNPFLGLRPFLRFSSHWGVEKTGRNNFSSGQPYAAGMGKTQSLVGLVSWSGKQTMCWSSLAVSRWSWSVQSHAFRRGGDSKGSGNQLLEEAQISEVRLGWEVRNQDYSSTRDLAKGLKLADKILKISS